MSYEMDSFCMHQLATDNKVPIGHSWLLQDTVHPFDDKNLQFGFFEKHIWPCGYVRYTFLSFKLVIGCLRVLLLSYSQFK